VPRISKPWSPEKISVAELDEHVRRVLRSEFASGTVDFPVQKSVIDVQAGLETSRFLAERSIVPASKMKKEFLPAGSRQGSVDRSHWPTRRHRHDFRRRFRTSGIRRGTRNLSGNPKSGFPTSPLQAIRAKQANLRVAFDSGANPESAGKLASKSDVALVFAYQWMSEEMDLPNLSLPENQDALIEKVAKANPHTIVILETGPRLPCVDR